MKKTPQIPVLCKVDPELVAKVQTMIRGRTVVVRGVSHGKPFEKTAPMGVANFFVETVEDLLKSVEPDREAAKWLRSQCKKTVSERQGADEDAEDRHRLHARASYLRGRIKELSAKPGADARGLAALRRNLDEVVERIRALPDRRMKA